MVRGIIVLALTGATIVACLWSAPTVFRSEAGIDLDLPGFTNGFTGTEQAVSDSERTILPPDTEFAKKLYGNQSGDRINCQIVLAGGEKRSIHRPEVCLPAQGWSVQSGKVIPITMANGEKLEVMLLNIVRRIALPDGQTHELTSLFLYWFVGKDTTTPHHLVRVLKTNLDTLLHNTNHRWAYVIVSAPVLEGITPQGKNAEQTLTMLKEFVALLAPEVMKDETSADQALRAGGGPSAD